MNPASAITIQIDNAKQTKSRTWPKFPQDRFPGSPSLEDPFQCIRIVKTIHPAMRWNTNFQIVHSFSSCFKLLTKSGKPFCKDMIVFKVNKTCSYLSQDSSFEHLNSICFFQLNCQSQLQLGVQPPWIFCGYQWWQSREKRCFRIAHGLSIAAVKPLFLFKTAQRCKPWLDSTSTKLGVTFESLKKYQKTQVGSLCLWNIIHYSFTSVFNNGTEEQTIWSTGFWWYFFK